MALLFISSLLVQLKKQQIMMQDFGPKWKTQVEFLAFGLSLIQPYCCFSLLGSESAEGIFIHLFLSLPCPSIPSYLFSASFPSLYSSFLDSILLTLCSFVSSFERQKDHKKHRGRNLQLASSFPESSSNQAWARTTPGAKALLRSRTRVAGPEILGSSYVASLVALEGAGSEMKWLGTKQYSSLGSWCSEWQLTLLFCSARSPSWF